MMCIFFKPLCKSDQQLIQVSQSSLGLLLFLCVTSFHRNTRPPSHGCNLLKEVGQAASLEELHNRLSAGRDLQKTQVDITMNQLFITQNRFWWPTKIFSSFKQSRMKNEKLLWIVSVCLCSKRRETL